MKARKIYLIGISALFVAFLITASVGATESLEVKTIENSKMISMELVNPSADAINVILFDAFYDNQGSFFTEAFAMNRLQRGSYNAFNVQWGDVFSRIQR